MLKNSEAGRERVGMGEEEKVDVARKAYAENDSDENAGVFARELFNLLGGQEKDKSESTVKKIKEIYKDHPTDIIAVEYAKAILLLTYKKDKDEFKQTAEEIKSIYSKFKTNNKLKRIYVFTLLTLISKQEENEREEKANIFIKMIREGTSVDVIRLYKTIEAYPKFNSIFADFKIDAKEPIEIKLNEIFEQLSEIQGRADIKIELVFLLDNVMKLKKMLMVSPKRQKIKEICHYTRLKSIKYILGATVKESGGTKETKFRLNNSEYMNDPSEGKTFIELLKKQLVEGETSEVLTNVLDRYYPSGCQEDNVREEIVNSNIYLSSFSESIDSLPMWSQYGDDGKGCCLVMEDGIFDKKENNDYDINAIHNGMSLVGANETGEKYVLYHVTYVENNALNSEEEEEKLKLIKKIAKSLIKVDENIKQLSNENLKAEIDEFIIATLDQVRFLFKDKTYQHEKELRLVKFSEKPCLDNNENLIVPKLYIEMEKEIKYKEIILGPKITQPSEIAPYIYSTKKIKKVSRSAIRYR